MAESVFQIERGNFYPQFSVLLFFVIPFQVYGLNNPVAGSFFARKVKKQPVKSLLLIKTVKKAFPPHKSS